MRRNAAILTVVAVAVRVLLAVFFSGPSLSPDSATYRVMSSNLFRLSSSNYLGIRTPGYPLAIRVLGSNLDVVWFVQAALGLASCLLLYWTVLRLTERAGLALAAGLVFSLSMNVLFFETEILTEPIVLFLLTASMFIFTLLVTQEKRWPWALLLGLLTGVAALTRPEAVALIVVWPVAFLMARTRSVTSQPVPSGRLVRVAAMVLPGVLAVGAWSGVNAEIVGQFSPTTLTGLNLVDHLGSSVSSAPDRYAVIRDIYVKARNRSIAEGFGDENVSYGAMGAMEHATGKSFAAVSQQLTSMSLAVIVHHPEGYAKVTAKSWVRSWDAPIYWQPAKLHSGVRSVARDLWDAERPLLVALNVAFLLLCVSALTRRFRRCPHLSRRLGMTLMGVVVVMSFPQALLANGENGRYMFPYYPMILVALAVGTDVWLKVRHDAGVAP